MAYKEVEAFLSVYPDYPPLLKNKILQAAYPLYRKYAGFRAGQFILINLPDIGINNERFLVKSVVATSTGGGTFKYSISIVSTELLGILRFLINLLESDKNALDIDPNEVVDEITTVSGESFSLTHGTPVLTLRSGAYKYDDGAQWNVSEWWK